MNTIRQARDATVRAIELVAGHADAAHSGVVDADCDRCVSLAADCGVDLTRRSS